MAAGHSGRLVPRSYLSFATGSLRTNRSETVCDERRPEYSGGLPLAEKPDVVSGSFVDDFGDLQGFLSADGEQALGFGWIGGEFGEALLNWS